MRETGNTFLQVQKAQYQQSVFISLFALSSQLKNPREADMISVLRKTQHLQYRQEITKRKSIILS